MLEPIFIDGREISSQHKPYIIAEISANHNGSMTRALETILAAKIAGADAVKIQTYTPDTMTIDSKKSDFLISKGLWKGRSLYDLYTEAFTPFKWHYKLFEYAKEIGITLFSTPFDETAVDLLDELGTPAYKVSSFELVDLPLIAYIAKKGKPMLLSTGMATEIEITAAIDMVRSSGCQQLAIFHCISGYPTPIHDANLRMIDLLRTKFDLQVGLSDHTQGNIASVVATGLGATLIEKHFTLSRSDGGLDSEFSLEPKEMAKLVEHCEDAFNSLGQKSFQRPVLEADSKIFRRSIYFVEDLKEGDFINEDNIRRIRPGYGLSPKYFKNIIGARLKTNVSRGDRVKENVLDLAKGFWDENN
jgi:N-acetylneuraminate synthase